MKKLLFLTISILCVLALLPLTTLAAGNGNGRGNAVERGNGKAKHGQKERQKNKQIKLILPLTPPAEAASDLAAANGKFDYRRNKGRTKLMSVVRLPLNAASIGIVDAAADVHLVITQSQEGLEPVSEDCKLSFVPPKDEEPSFYQYRLHINRNTPRGRVKKIKGDCETLLKLAASDEVAVSVYVNVAETPITILSSSNQ